MSTRLLDLSDRVITDTGTMVAKHNLLTKLALNGQPFAHLPYVPHPDVDHYHKLKGSHKTAMRWVESDELTGPADSTYHWNIPHPYSGVSIADICEDALVDLQLDSDVYLDRLVTELTLIEDRGMEDFLRCLLWITDTFRENDVVWGLGRGSSCASLVLYLLGINKVDPVRYDIPLEEFYK